MDLGPRIRTRGRGLEPPGRPRVEAALTPPVPRPRVVRLRVAGTTLAVRAPAAARPGCALPEKLRPLRAVPRRRHPAGAVGGAGSRSGPVAPALRVGRPLAGVRGRRRLALPVPVAARGRPPPARGLRIDSAWSRGTLYLPPSAYSRRARVRALLPARRAAVRAPLRAPRAPWSSTAAGSCRERARAALLRPLGRGQDDDRGAVAALRRGTRVLSDDRIVAAPAPGPALWMYGTPWHGSGRFASPEGAPLDAVFFLRQADALARGRAPDAGRRGATVRAQLPAALVGPARSRACSTPAAAWRAPCRATRSRSRGTRARWRAALDALD